MKIFGPGERTWLRAIGAVTVALLFCLPGFSQLNLGRIFGAVTDQTGGLISGATVTVTDVARGISRPLVSDSAGEYDAASLTPGTYTVRAEAKGFKIAEHTDIEVGVGKEVKIDFSLQPGAQTQTVTVTGDIPSINTANAQLGGTLEQTAVDELPVEGRNYQYLIGTQPGMVMAPTGGQFTYISDGVSNHMEMWMVDGLMNTNENVGGPSLVGGASQNGDEGTILPLDAIQEVEMIENPNAVYGDKPGAHVNVGLKSGTNALHGSAYAYGKDGAWAAKNPFLTATLPKGPLALEQFGGSVGGPIKKDKIFYFANYEGQRYAAGVPKTAFEPTTTSGAGAGQSIPDGIFDIFHNPKNAGPTPAAVPVSALSLNLSGCSALVNGQVTPSGFLSPAQGTVLKSMTASQLAAGCNVATGLFGNSGTSQNEVLDLLGSGGSDNGIIKVDVHLNDHQSLNFDWFSGGGNVVSPGSAVQPYWEADAHTWANMARAVWIWTPNSTWLNEFRFGYDYGNLPIYVRECDKPGIGPNYASLGFVSGAPGCESILSSGNVLGGFPLTTIGAFTVLGESNGNIHDQAQHYYTFLDNISWTHGKHVVTFGTESRFLNYTADARGGIGTLSIGTTSAFTSATPLEDFLTGTTTSGTLLVGNSVRNVERPSTAVFVQDAWRVLPTLTVNAGLRYEWTGALTEKNNLLGNFDPSQPITSDPAGLIQEASGKNIYNPYNLNFGPRLGVAWDVFGNGKTVIHAGTSVLFDSQPYLLELLFSGQVSTIPTGYTFVNPNGSTFAGPGNIAAATLNPQGGIPGAVGNTLGWSVGNPVFQGLSVSGLACGNGLAVPTGSPAGTKAPSFCQLSPYDLHMRYPYYFIRTLGIQHAFTNNISLTAAYVGNVGDNLDSQNNINAPTPGVSGTAAEQARRPYNTAYPFYSNILYVTHGEKSNYDGIQISFVQRVSHGLSYTAGYTFSHTLDNVGTAMNPMNPMLDYGNSSINFPSIFNFTATYVIPGKKSPGQLLEGWHVNSTVYLLSGGSLNANDPTDDLSGVSGGGAGEERWTMSPGGNVHNFKIGGPGAAVPCYGVAGSLFASYANCQRVANIASMPALCMSTAAAEAINPSVPTTNANATGLEALANFGCYMAGNTAIVPPAQGTFGTMAANALYDKPFHNWDFSVTKNWKFRERYGVEFRAEFFNVLNRTFYSAPTANLHFANSFGESTASPDSGNPVIGNGPRKIQLGLHISF